MSLPESLDAARRLLLGQLTDSEIATLAAEVPFHALGSSGINGIRLRSAAAYLGQCVSIPLIVKAVRDVPERIGATVYVNRHLVLANPETDEEVPLDSDISYLIESLHDDPEDDVGARLMASWLAPVGLRFTTAGHGHRFEVRADPDAIERLENFYEAAQLLMREQDLRQIAIEPAQVAAAV